jgi:hypothetical protein
VGVGAYAEMGCGCQCGFTRGLSLWVHIWVYALPWTLEGRTAATCLLVRGWISLHFKYFRRVGSRPLRSWRLLPYAPVWRQGITPVRVPGLDGLSLFVLFFAIALSGWTTSSSSLAQGMS